MVLSHNLPRGSAEDRIAVRVKAKAAKALRQGHPWLFEDSIEKISREGRAGDVAVAFNQEKSVLGAGLYDPTSPVRVKLLSFGVSKIPVGRELFSKLCLEAKQLRDGKLAADTNAWRLINGESDGFPGMVADKYADVLVLKIYTPAFIPWLGDIADCFFELYPELRRLAIRFSREVQRMSDEVRFGISDGALFTDGAQPWDGSVRFIENGITFEADVKSGQKTGFFLDQRDNRAAVGELAKGASKVLNLFSYSGGFSLYAARAGAAEVYSVDFSKHAIAAACHNFELNSNDRNIARCKHFGITGDAFAVMDEMEKDKKLFDIVVVDPPSFAKSVAEKDTAIKSYARLARSAVKLVRKNGILVFASCSSRISADELFEVVHQTAASVNRPLDEFSRTSHAIDHPAKFKESNYLKCLYARALTR
jgi:23S rRNA (cytosine1962-C5)-methyltransferase